MVDLHENTAGNILPLSFHVDLPFYFIKFFAEEMRRRNPEAQVKRKNAKEKRTKTRKGRRRRKEKDHMIKAKTRRRTD